MKVFTDLKARGCQGLLSAVTDGRKGMEEALAAVFPQTTLQTASCIGCVRVSTSPIGNRGMGRPLPDDCRRLAPGVVAGDSVLRRRCIRAWTLPSLWTHRTRPQRLGKPPRTRFPTDRMNRLAPLSEVVACAPQLLRRALEAQ
jgi:hypothetical protein